MSSKLFRPWFFRRSDQPAIVGALIVCFGVLGGWFFMQKAESVAFGDVDRAVTREFAFQIDLNRAGANEIAVLPGVGKILAERIVDYRDRRGRIASVEELLEINGIGKKVLEKFRPYLLPMEKSAGG